MSNFELQHHNYQLLSVGKVFFSGRAARLPIVCMWVLGIVTVLPHNYRGVFGYDCRVGYCSMIKTDNSANKGGTSVYDVRKILEFWDYLPPLSVFGTDCGSWC